MNSVNLMGRLTADVEVRQTTSGIAVCSFTIAVDSYENGERSADFIPIVAWRNTAETVGKYFRKGQMIAISGKLKLRQYTDKDGNKRTVSEVVADRIYFTGKQETQSAQSMKPKNYDNEEASFEDFEDIDVDFPF